MGRVEELMDRAESLVYAERLAEKMWGKGPRSDDDSRSEDCMKARTELRTALSACVTEWRPISEAPRDGTRILAFDPEAGVNICYPKAFPKPVDGYTEDWPRDKWEIFRDDKHCIGHSWSCFPTHYQPLPTPPTETEGETK